ncbi:MAG: hypothetical protein KC486_09530, partial [Myxococcales bacterium]|nr:hypothetical protein [Myxococcales bacterium]
ALALLLDGLDEVPSGRRDACGAAINAYRDEHGVAAIAVTCREDEGVELRAPLQLDDAVALRPLTQAAVVDALPVALRGSLAADPALRDLARQPLFLGILRQLDAADVAAIEGAGELEARRLAVFDRYVRGALTRVRSYSGVEAAGGAAPALAGGDEGRALRWLAWLGRAMTRGRGVFLLEELQPRDLATARARWVYVALTRGVVAAALFAWLLLFGRGGGWRELTALGVAAAVVLTIAGGRLLAGDARGISTGGWRSSAAILVAVPALFAGVALLMVPEARAEPRAWFTPARLAVAGVVTIACAIGHVVRRGQLARGRDVVAPETRRFDRRRFGWLVALVAVLPALAVGGVLSWRAAEAAVVWDVDSGARRALDADLAHTTRALGWTADGRHVVINRYERAKIVDVDRDLVVRELEGWILAISADGREVVGDTSEGLRSWRTDAWDAPLAIDLGERGAWRFPLELSADGRSLLVGVGADGDREASGHLLLSAEDGRVLRVFPPACAAPGGEPASCTESLRWSGDRRHLVRTRGDGEVEAFAVDPQRGLVSVEAAELDDSTAVGAICEAAVEGGGATIERVTPDAAGDRVALVIDAVDGPRTEVWDVAARARLLRAPGRGALSPDGARLFTHRSVSAPLPVSAASLVAGLLLALALAFRPGVDSGRARVNEGIRRSLWRALAAFVGGLLVVVALVLGYGASQGLIRGGALATPLFFAVVVGIAVGAAVALAVGGFAALGHAILRLLLAREGAAPLAYGRLLERATERALLRRVGGGYVFYHRLLAEYFAAHAERRLAAGRRADAE